MKEFVTVAVTVAAAILATGGPVAAWGAAIPGPTVVQSTLPPAGMSFKDCADCPEMVVVPAGSFTMGSPESEEYRDIEEGPRHRVTIPRDFAVGMYEVTREEYARFVSETNRPDPDTCYAIAYPDGRRVETAGQNWRNPGFAQGERDPVACVSWDDAQAYAQWLSTETGKSYRLLSEAEWEYATRAGTSTARYGSDDPVQQCGYISGGEINYTDAYPGDTDVNQSCRDGYSYSSPVGSFPPNPFGLYDMLGNMSEWTGDCWNESYDGAPGNGGAWTVENCEQRVFRGGSWTNGPRSLRAAYRDWRAPEYLTARLGFRIARTN